MASGNSRPLSEVEIQVLAADNPPRRRPASSHVSTNILNSLDDILLMSSPQSLEDVHREHVYTSMHSQFGKDQDNSFDSRPGIHRSWSESEKSRYARRKSYKRERRKNSAINKSEETLNKALEGLQVRMRCTDAGRDKDIKESSEKYSGKNSSSESSPEIRRRVYSQGNPNESANNDIARRKSTEKEHRKKSTIKPSEKTLSALEAFQLRIEFSDTGGDKAIKKNPGKNSDKNSDDESSEVCRSVNRHETSSSDDLEMEPGHYSQRRRNTLVNVFTG